MDYNYTYTAIGVREVDVQKSPKLLLLLDIYSVAVDIINYFKTHAEIACPFNSTEQSKLIADTRWDLVIVDIDYHGAAATQIIQSIRTANPWAYFLIIAQPTNDSSFLDVLNLHVDGVIFKPIEKNYFINIAFKLAEDAILNRKRKQKIILAIGSHPDDLEIGAGGSLTLHKSKGHLIHFLTLSHGEYSGDPDKRTHESMLAAEKLQVNLFLRSLEDACFSDNYKTIRVIEEVVDQIQPTHVYTHSQHDTHQDHRYTHLASIAACRNIPNVFCYQSPSFTVDFKPALFTEISSHIDMKLDLIACYASQSDVKPYLQKNFIYSLARYWGRYCSYGLAEAFEIIRTNSL